MKLSTQNAQRLIKQFENAVRNDEMKGSMHPDDWEEIEDKYIKHKKKLFSFILDCILK